MRKHPVFPVAFVNVSYGNDSIALIRWAFERGLPQKMRCVCIYADTGWARDSWTARVVRAEAWARSLGFETVRTSSIGFEAVVRKKVAFPRQGIQFCTQMLKIEPLVELADSIDPERRAVVLIGKRREESVNRRETLEYLHEDPYNGLRMIWHPLYLHSDAERDELIVRTPLEILPHRSDECWPCVNANKADLRRLSEDEARVQYIEGLEASMGVTAKGAPRVMYHPYRYRGATGIRAMIRWANTDRGGDFDDGTGLDCAYGSAGCGL